MEDDILLEEEDEEDLDDTMSDASGPLTPSIHTSVHGPLLVTTSNDHADANPSAVMIWEDLFGKIAGKHIKSCTLANLPYRTLDIDVSKARVVQLGDGPVSSDGVRMDTCNKADDVSFRPYSIREAVSMEAHVVFCSIVIHTF
jgi:hypothetical protein